MGGLQGNGKPAPSINEPTKPSEEREREKLFETVAEWDFLWPVAEDAQVAARTELMLNCSTYHVAMLGRAVRGKRCIIVAYDNDQGVKAANAVVDACDRAKAAAAHIWRLAGYGTEHADLASWCKVYVLDNEIAFEEPWKPRKSIRPAETHGDLLLRITQGLELFRTPDGDAYATIEIRGRPEHHRVVSEQVFLWLLHGFYRETGKAPSNEVMLNTLKILSARAQCEPGIKVCPVALRVGADPASTEAWPIYYLDLADEERRAVRMEPGKWKIVADVPVRFRRPKAMAALPTPERGGSIEELWEFLNLSCDDHRLLAIASMTADMLPRGPYPVKVITGEQGSCKSTATKLFKRLVDPRTPALGSVPLDLRDLMVIAKGTWIISLDNLSSIPTWLSDALARLATGAGFSTRKLHTDDEEVIFEASRPVILNSIEEITGRPDLLDRSIVLTCPPMPEELRRKEREFFPAFERAYPRILGALLDAVAGGLAMLPLIKLDRLARMADFAEWGEAVCRGLGHPDGAFMGAFSLNREAASASVLEDSPVAAELIAFCPEMRRWTGTNKELLEILRTQAAPDVRDSARFPKNPRALSGHLRRIAPALRRNGIDVVFPDGRNPKRLFSIIWTPVRTPEYGSRPSLPSLPQPDPPF